MDEAEAIARAEAMREAGERARGIRSLRSRVEAHPNEPAARLLLAATSAVLVARVAVGPSASRAARTAAGRDALRELAAELTGADPAVVTVRARCATCGGPHGRPVLGGSRALDALHASVAHAGDVVVVAVSAEGPIGIDAEPRGRDAPPGMALAEWVRIEAVLKADGRGLLVDPSLVRFANDVTGSAAWIDGGAARYQVVDVDLAPGLVSAVARLSVAAGPILEVSIRSLRR